MPYNDFPQTYIEQLSNHLENKAFNYLSRPEDRLLVYSGILLNWIGEYITDESMEWSLQTVAIDDLYLTGTSPQWNEIVIKQAGRSPAALRNLIKQDSKIAEVFSECQLDDTPILVRQEEQKLKVLDGMHRTIAAIRDDHQSIQAYVGVRRGQPAPKVEPHVVYDILRAHRIQGGNADDFVAALRYLMQHYTNVKPLLMTRFKAEWEEDSQISPLIKQLLESE